VAAAWGADSASPVGVGSVDILSFYYSGFSQIFPCQSAAHDTPYRLKGLAAVEESTCSLFRWRHRWIETHALFHVSQFFLVGPALFGHELGRLGFWALQA